MSMGLGMLERDLAGLLNNKVRAQRLDEALEILASRWCGKPLEATMPRAGDA